MTGAWYWYLEELDYRGEYRVRIHAEKPGYVQGQYWVIPFKDRNYDRWHVYLQPWWIAEKAIGSQALMTPPTLDCEWVFVKRVKWEPPPKGVVDYTCTICESCGQEVWT
jgi:hypothetical protein